MNLKVEPLEALAPRDKLRFAYFDAHRSASSRMLIVFIISPLQASARRGSPVNSDSRNLRYSMPMRRLRSPAVNSCHTRFSARYRSSRASNHLQTSADESVRTVASSLLNCFSATTNASHAAENSSEMQFFP